MPASSTLGDILNAVQAAAIAINLTSITTNVLIRKFPWIQDGVTMPVLYVCPIQELLPNQGTNRKDDTGYGVQVSAARSSNRDTALVQADQLLEWRDKLIRGFRQDRLSGVTGSYLVTVEPGPVFDPVAFANMLDGTTIYLRCWCREARL